MENAHRLPLLLLAAACAALPVFADDDKRDKRREGKEEFWDGRCKVEREWKHNGDFKQERKCEGGGDRFPERKAEFWDGPCKVEQEWKKDGSYKEEHKCGDGRGRRGGTPMAAAGPAAYPPWVVVERGEPVYRPGQAPAPARGAVAQCHSETVGRVLGGVAGAVLGHQVGQGSGRTAATIGGAIAGVLIGGEIGRRIDAANQACIGQALEFAPAGQRVQWPGDGTHYAVVPGAVVTHDGAHCRPYQAEVLTDAGWQKTRARACRRSDGTWVAAR